MSWFNNARNWLLGAKQTPQTPLPQRSLNRILQRQMPFRIEMEMDKWRMARMSAESIVAPNRRNLYAIYDNVTKEDDEVRSQIRTANTYIEGAQFEVRIGDNEVIELTKLFQKTWFSEYLKLVLGAEFWGHSLIELKFDGEAVTHCELVDRNHVIPETGQIALSLGDLRGWRFRGDVIAPELQGYHLVEFGDRFDLGLLLTVSKVVIRKEYSDTDWSRRNERFGTPFTALNTDARSAKELDEKEAMLKNMGINGWAILDTNDKINFHEAAHSDGHKTFWDRMCDADKRIAKLINGQTGTSENGAWAGTAGVHERVQSNYTLARLRRLQKHVNETLIPKLTSMGMPLNGASLAFLDLEAKPEVLVSESENDSSEKKN